MGKHDFLFFATPFFHYLYIPYLILFSTLCMESNRMRRDVDGIDIMVSAGGVLDYFMTPRGHPISYTLLNIN